jgi:hypothetical protein
MGAEITQSVSLMEFALNFDQHGNYVDEIFCQADPP